MSLSSPASTVTIADLDASESDSIFGKITDGTVGLFTGKYLTPDEAFWGGITIGSVGLVAGSVVARKRAKQGLKPIAGILF